MANCLQFALADSLEGRDREFNQWYDDHLPYVVSVPMYSAGQRFRRSDGPWPQTPQEYLTIWELDDPDATLPEMTRRREAGESHHSEDIDPATVQPPTMWRRAMARNRAAFDSPTGGRAGVILAMFNAKGGDDDRFAAGMVMGHLSGVADQPGVCSAEFLTLSERQIRNRARKYRHALLVELTEPDAAIPALAERMRAIAAEADQQWSATVYRAMGPRLTTHAALAR